jgi:hypothetical protein
MDGAVVVGAGAVVGAEAGSVGWSWSPSVPFGRSNVWPARMS